ncbi:hypothetical protein [Algisphaera agarilytica]|uniref:Pilus assembly protein CpaB n=1 Tax=Algisphaera agarilytica TaxID=1385975 RepID=A0A7X0LJ01_9BACT|nr:hypothetical protein [Algisphaera agarilytica]MBB6428264.1 hypothetical protein [Algisphaera agarilytica]
MSQMPGSPTVPLPKKPGNLGVSNPGPAPASPKLVGLALLIALIAVVLVNLYIIGIKKAAQEGEFRFFRLVVAKDVGQTLELEDVRLVGVPESFRDAFRDVVESNSQGQPLRLGDPFTRRAEVGEPLTTRMFDDLTGDEARRLITQGYRGVSLPVVSKTLPDPLKSEMRVDILAPVRAPGGRQEILPVMENVRVVSVGSRTIVDEKSGGRASSNFETLTVEVRPDEAVLFEAITQEVQKTGVYRVLLRSPDDQRQAYITEGGLNPEILERFGLSAASRQ